MKQSVEFIIDKSPLGECGFRVAFKASCSTPWDAFNAKSWVVKKFLPKTLEAVQLLDQTPEEHARHLVQMHCLACYFVQQFAKRIAREAATISFESFVFQKVYLGVTDSGEVVTIEEFISGTFTKYINNTGFLFAPEDNVIGQKAETFVHFSYELSNENLMAVNIQGSSFDLYDPEIANSDQAANVNEMLFCAGNLNAVAMSNFKSQHKCNMFCKLLHLKELSQSVWYNVLLMKIKTTWLCPFDNLIIIKSKNK